MLAIGLAAVIGAFCVFGANLVFVNDNLTSRPEAQYCIRDYTDSIKQLMPEYDRLRLGGQDFPRSASKSECLGVAFAEARQPLYRAYS